MDWLFSWLESFVDWLTGMLKHLVETLVIIWEDIFAWSFDQLMALVVSIIGGLPSIDVSGTVASLMSQMPPAAFSFFVKSGVGPAMAILSVALLIRFLMGLVPFIRLGR